MAIDSEIELKNDAIRRINSNHHPSKSLPFLSVVCFCSMKQQQRSIISTSISYCCCLCLLGILFCVESASPQAYRRDPGHPTWHHGAFQDVKDSVRSDVRQMLHSRAEVIHSTAFQALVCQLLCVCTLYLCSCHMFMNTCSTSSLNFLLIDLC